MRGRSQSIRGTFPLHRFSISPPAAPHSVAARKVFAAPFRFTDSVYPHPRPRCAWPLAKYSRHLSTFISLTGGEPPPDPPRPGGRRPPPGPPRVRLVAGIPAGSGALPHLVGAGFASPRKRAPARDILFVSAHAARLRLPSCPLPARTGVQPSFSNFMNNNKNRRTSGLFFTKNFRPNRKFWSKIVRG